MSSRNGRSDVGKAKRLFRLVLTLLVAPFRFCLTVKRTLTSASVTLMLISLMSLNIIWGYPWTGMLAACLACLFMGFICNWLTRARLSAGCKLPRSVTVAQPFRVTTHLVNQSRFPGLDTLVGWQPDVKPSRASRRSSLRNGFGNSAMETSEPEFYSLLRAGEQTQYVSLMKFYQRGIRDLPPLMVQSTFPFYLFRFTRLVDVGTSIAVTPLPLDGQKDQDARRVLASVGDWARRLLAGDATEYVGSREYTQGMPVRRWDFASWARLGRPIVRDFKAPSVRSMNLIVDTAEFKSVVEASGQMDADAAFEYLMSMTVSVLDLLSTASVTVQLFLADEMPEQATPHQAYGQASQADSGNATTHGKSKKRRENEVASGLGSDRESQLIRLAMSNPVDVKTADDSILAAMETLGREPTILLTRRPVEQFAHLGGNLSLMRVDPSQATNDVATGPLVAGDSATSQSGPETSANLDVMEVTG